MISGKNVVSLGAAVALGLGGVLAMAPAASAATTTVGNGLTTADLTSVGITPTVLAQDLAGPGVTVSNVQFHGASAQAGRLHALDPAVVSFNDGIILSSGNVADVVGPNKSESTTGDMGGGNDPDLDALIKNSQTVNPVTFDAASLEFDFVPTASTVYFTYAFGSDEYLEWVNLFNDVFGFYVNGNNCATVANGDPVSIDTINSNVNSSLYRDNSFWNPPTQPINIESDGLSVELICKASVNPGVTNHMKLAIADTSDQILDSVVMLKRDSLTVTKPESCNDGADNDDDTLVDMEDSSCKSTTTPPPPGASGVGSSNTAPPFTGNEGTPIPLDASALGWKANGETVSTSWTVHGINGTTGTCTIDPEGKQPLGPGGSIAVVNAYCPADGEYVARVDGWDSENKSAFDYDVDFFVHNAPPAVTIDAPAADATVDVGAPVDLSATVSDPGADDSVSCEVNWGDGTKQAGDLTDGTCTQSHDYSAQGTYLISVTGKDNVGSSAAAAQLITVGSSGPSVPAAPDAPTAVRASKSATVNWTAPADGGAAIDGYNVQVATDPAGPFSDAPGCTGLAVVTTCKATGLTNGTGYYFTVSAHNAAGWGPYSAASAMVVPATAPGAPTALTATSATSGTVTTSWTAPASNGGVAVDKYQAKAYNGSTVAATCYATAPATNCTITGLPAKTYTVKVFAHNAVGWGTASAASAPVVVTGVPQAPQSPVATGSPAKVTAAWSAPASDGGLAIDNYSVSVYRQSNSSLAGTCTTATTSCAVSGLAQGSYSFKVKAHNAAGWGPLATSGPVTITGLPGAPQSVGLVSPGAGKATASWSAPASDGGATIDQYRVRAYFNGGSSTVRNCYTNGAAGSCAMTGLTAGAYRVTVTAHNSAGWGPASAKSASVTVG